MIFKLLELNDGGTVYSENEKGEGLILHNFAHNFNMTAVHL